MSRLLIVFIFLCNMAGAQRLNRAFDWYDKPDTKNDSLNLALLKIKSIKIVRVYKGIDTTVEYTSVIRFDTTGRMLTDSTNGIRLKYINKYTYDLKSHLIKKEVTEDHNGIHNICVYKYDSKGNIKEMDAKILGNFYEGDVRKVKYNYDDRNLLINVYFFDTKGELNDYWSMEKYYYEYYK